MERRLCVDSCVMMPCLSARGHDEKMQQLWLLCDRLPKPNHDNLKSVASSMSQFASYDCQAFALTSFTVIDGIQYAYSSTWFNVLAVRYIFLYRPAVFDRYLIKFLAKLSENSDINKMSPSNIAIVMGPNLIWPQGGNG